MDCFLSYADVNLKQIAPMLKLSQKSLWQYIHGYRQPDESTKEQIEKLALELDTQREIYLIEVNNNRTNGGNDNG